MSPTCDDVHYRPEPLGTVMPCGCVVRALLMTCEVCSTEQWMGAPTDAELGDHARVRGFCLDCGASVDQWAMVHAQPIPPALRS